MHHNPELLARPKKPIVAHVLVLKCSQPRASIKLCFPSNSKTTCLPRITFPIGKSLPPTDSTADSAFAHNLGLTVTTSSYSSPPNKAKSNASNPLNSANL